MPLEGEGIPERGPHREAARKLLGEAKKAPAVQIRAKRQKSFCWKWLEVRSEILEQRWATFYWQGGERLLATRGLLSFVLKRGTASRYRGRNADEKIQEGGNPVLEDREAGRCTSVELSASRRGDARLACRRKGDMKG